jgi:hypothetical protein
MAFPLLISRSLLVAFGAGGGSEDLDEHLEDIRRFKNHQVFFRSVGLQQAQPFPDTLQTDTYVTSVGSRDRAGMGEMAD